MIKVFIMAMIVLILSSSASAENYYYADWKLTNDCTTGNYSRTNRTCTGRDGKAYNTVAKAIKQAAAGDTVYVRAGTWAIWLTTAASGTAENKITIRAYGSETVNIQKARVIHNYIVLSGFTATDPGIGSGGDSAAIYISGSYNTLSGNTVKGSILATSAGSYGMCITGNYNTITGNTFDGGLNYVGTHTGSNNSADLVDSTKSWATNELQGMYVKNYGMQGTPKYVYNTSITSNTSDTLVATLNGSEDWDTGDNYMAGQGLYIVVQIAGTNNTISNNIIKNLVDVERIFDFAGNCDNTTFIGNEAYGMKWSCSWANCGNYTVHPDIFQRVKPTSGDSNCRNGLIENHYFHDMNLQIGIFESNTGDEISNWIVRNNVFANIGQRMMFGSYIYNNTFFQVNSGTGAVIDLNGGCDAVNNIIIGGNVTSTTGIIVYNGTQSKSVVRNNYFALPMDSGYAARSAANVASKGGTDYINGGDPKFVAAYNNCMVNACDFRLQSNSPLKDKGADLSGIWPSASDKDGVTRPYGARWDIGAYEYNIPPERPIQPRIKK